MADRKTRVEGDTQEPIWIKLYDNGDGTHSAAMADPTAHTKLDELETKLDTVITLLQGTLNVTIV